MTGSCGGWHQALERGSRSSGGLGRGGDLLDAQLLDGAQHEHGSEGLGQAVDARLHQPPQLRAHGPALGLAVGAPVRQHTGRRGLERARAAGGFGMVGSLSIGWSVGARRSRAAQGPRRRGRRGP
jgi:hypothetical protein